MGLYIFINSFNIVLLVKLWFGGADVFTVLFCFVSVLFYYYYSMKS